MGTIIVSIIIGGLIGALGSFAVSAAGHTSAPSLWIINIVLGALGAIAAGKLLTVGPILFSISIIPTIVGALVLVCAGSLVFMRLNHSHN